MKRKDSTVVLNVGDLSGWLARAASRLRNEGLSLVGRASLESRPGDREFEDAAEHSGSLERIASVLDALRDELCVDCQAIDISEYATLGIPPGARNARPKKKGGTNHE